MSHALHGIEVLLKKAAVDPAFRRLLLEKRAKAAREIGLELSEAGTDILAGFPREQLEEIIENTRVEPGHRTLFLGRVGRITLATVIAGTALTALMVPSMGHTVRISEEMRRKMAEREAELLRQMQAERTRQDVDDSSRPDESPGADANNPDLQIGHQ